MRGIAATTTSLVLAWAAAAGCVETADTDLDGRSGFATPTAPAESPPDRVVDEIGARSDLVVDGSYALASTLQIEAVALMPSSAYQAVQVLEGLRDRPAETLFDLAEQAGVPAVGTLRDALPSSLESRLYGWIDGYLQQITTGDGTVAQVLDTVIGVCHAPIGELRLASALTVDGDRATHRLDTVEIEVAGHALAYDVAPLAAIGVELEATVAATVVRDRDGARIGLAGHGFGLPYGKLAWRALDDLVGQRYGRDLRGQLGAMVDCPALARTVASKCVLGLCVGHEAELTAICEAGLDQAVDQVRGRIEAATVEPLILSAGTARVDDGQPADGVASSLAGTWTAAVDLGVGPRPAPATFTGTRR